MKEQNIQTLTEGVYSKEALQWVREHLRELMGPATLAPSQTRIRVSKLQMAQVLWRVLPLWRVSFAAAAAAAAITAAATTGTAATATTSPDARGLSIPQAMEYSFVKH